MLSPGTHPTISKGNNFDKPVAVFQTSEHSSEGTDSKHAQIQWAVLYIRVPLNAIISWINTQTARPTPTISIKHRSTRCCCDLHPGYHNGSGDEGRLFLDFTSRAVSRSRGVCPPHHPALALGCLAEVHSRVPGENTPLKIKARGARHFAVVSNTVFYKKEHPR